MSNKIPSNIGKEQDATETAWLAGVAGATRQAKGVMTFTCNQRMKTTLGLASTGGSIVATTSGNKRNNGTINNQQQSTLVTVSAQQPDSLLFNFISLETAGVCWRFMPQGWGQSQQGSQSPVGTLWVQCIDVESLGFSGSKWPPVVTTH